jgi:universal stress protein E
MPVLLISSDAGYKCPVVLAAVDPHHTYSKPANLDREILSIAAAVTDALHGSLHAVHAFIPVPAGSFPDIAVSQQSTSALEALIAEVAKQGFDETLRSTEIPEGKRHLVGRHPIDAIEQVAREINSGIVVLGEVSRTGLKRLIIGNTAERLLDHLACDILIVKSPHFETKVPVAVRGVRYTAMLSTPAMN